MLLPAQPPIVERILFSLPRREKPCRHSRVQCSFTPPIGFKFLNANLLSLTGPFPPKPILLPPPADKVLPARDSSHLPHLLRVQTLTSSRKWRFFPFSRTKPSLNLTFARSCVFNAEEHDFPGLMSWRLLYHYSGEEDPWTVLLFRLRFFFISDVVNSVARPGVTRSLSSVWKNLEAATFGQTAQTSRCFCGFGRCPSVRGPCADFCVGDFPCLFSLVFHLLIHVFDKTSARFEVVTSLFFSR